jgi:hypothetical protein
MTYFNVIVCSLTDLHKNHIILGIVTVTLTPKAGVTADRIDVNYLERDYAYSELMVPNEEASGPRIPND